jgi:hypothetical protein
MMEIPQSGVADPNPDPLVRDIDPDPDSSSIIKQK